MTAPHDRPSGRSGGQEAPPARGRKRILFISWWWPVPPDNGSKLRIYHLLRLLATRHEITLLAFADRGEAGPAALATLKELCVAVDTVSKPRYRPHAVRAVAGSLSAWPRSLVDVYSARMADLVRDVLTRGDIDLVIASQLQTLRYLRLAPQHPRLLEELELAVFADRVRTAGTLVGRGRAALTWWKLRGAVARQLRDGIAATTVSAEELALARRVAPADATLAVVPNGVDTRSLAPDPDAVPAAFSVIYPGSVTYSANFDAVSFFVRNVLPGLRSRSPAVQLRVTGSTDGVDVRQLAARPGVRFTGRLDDVASAVRGSAVMVAPLRVGGGTRLKILEAMALGTPVVATSKAAEGLTARHEEHLLVADHPDDFRDAVWRLFEDEALRRRLTRAARELVCLEYDWEIVGGRLLDVVERLAPGPRGAGQAGGSDRSDRTLP